MISEQKKITALIIAAGLSGRMNNFKPLLNYKGKSFIQNIIQKLVAVCGRVMVVTGYKSDEVVNHLDKTNLLSRVDVIRNSSYKKGMFTSLQKGLEKLNEAEWILYHFVDQPNLPTEFYSEFITNLDNNFDWIQPSFNNRKGHPILFNRKVCKTIIDSKSDSNLRCLVRNKFNKKIWNCSYSEILTDIDTPEDYYFMK